MPTDRRPRNPSDKPPDQSRPRKTGPSSDKTNKPPRRSDNNSQEHNPNHSDNADQQSDEWRWAEAARQGDQEALASLFDQYRERLRKIVRFRLDSRLRGRVSESDVLQESFLRAVPRVAELSDKPSMSPFLWFRLLVQQQMIDLHRHHLQTAKRDAKRDRPIVQNEPGMQTSMAIAANLVAHLTSPSLAVQKVQTMQRITQALDQMSELDREIIALRHFEELSSTETAQFLEIDKSAASKRYIRALKRLRSVLAEVSGLTDMR